MFKRFIVFLFAVSVLAIVPNIFCGKPLLSEIINNTVEEIWVGRMEDSNGKLEAFHDLKMVSYNLESNELLAPEVVKTIKLGCVHLITLKPQTRNVFLGLEIPNGGMGPFTLCSSLLFYDHIIRHPQLFFAFNRAGEFMSVASPNGHLRNICIYPGKFERNGVPAVLNQKILENKHYSIRIDYAERQNLFNISFENITMPDIGLASYAKAFIGEFKPGTNTNAIVRVMIHFEQVVTLEFLEKFSAALRNKIGIRHGLIERVGRQQLSLMFYTDIRQEEIQLMIDNVNEISKL